MLSSKIVLNKVIQDSPTTFDFDDRTEGMEGVLGWYEWGKDWYMPGFDDPNWTRGSGVEGIPLPEESPFPIHINKKLLNQMGVGEQGHQTRRHERTHAIIDQKYRNEMFNTLYDDMFPQGNHKSSKGKTS